MKPEFMDKYPEILEDAWRKISECLQEDGYPLPLADEIAFLITEYLRSEWSGRMLYIMKKKPEAVVPQEALFDTAQTRPEAEATSNVLAPGQLAAMAGRFQEIIVNVSPAADPGLGDKLMEMLRVDWAGTPFFVPKGVVYDTMLRDYSLWRRWDGSYQSKLTLMREYSLTEQAFYAAIRRIRKSHLKRTQPKLPGVE